MRSYKLLVVMFASLAVVCVLGGLSTAQTVTPIYSFDGTTGSNPVTVRLTQGRDGNLYGATLRGGSNDFGAVFKISTRSNLLTVLHSFTGTDGSYPWGSLTLGTDGNFYGVTSEGGSGGWGVVFRMTPSGSLTVLHNFVQDSTDGFFPLSPPVQALDGNFYGVTANGGTMNNTGVLYKLTPSGTYTILYDYSIGIGSNQESSPVQGVDGFLYITSLEDGANGCGSIVKMSTVGSVSATHNFDCSINGNYPEGSLVQFSDGDFYGVTFSGGSASSGLLFKVDASLNFTALHSFGLTTTDLKNPTTALCQATDGNLYGVAYYGGTNGYGGIYQYTSHGSTNTLYSWGQHADPQGTLTQHTNGKMYSVTYQGGAHNLGTVYSLDMGLGPFITFVRPTGKVAQTAQILGQGLTGTTSVTFNGLSATSLSVVSDTYMTAVVPAGATTGPVVVTTPSGPLTSNVNFRISQ